MYYHLTVKLDSKQFSHLNIIILNIIVAKFLDGCKTNALKQVNSLLATPNLAVNNKCGPIRPEFNHRYIAFMLKQ